MRTLRHKDCSSLPRVTTTWSMELGFQPGWFGSRVALCTSVIIGSPPQNLVCRSLVEICTLSFCPPSCAVTLSWTLEWGLKEVESWFCSFCRCGTLGFSLFLGFPMCEWVEYSNCHVRSECVYPHPKRAECGVY